MLSTMRLTAWLVGIGLLGFTACTSYAPSVAPAATPETTRPAPSTPTAPPREEPPAFLTRDWKTDFGKHKVPYEEIISGGVPRDGIPPIYEPRFESIQQADSWLAASEPVVAFGWEGEARAYPLRILIWHEIVNDSVGGIPVAITYCPLCNTAVVFDRRLEGQTLTFGVSGMLRHSDLIMWDHQTES